MSQELSAGRSRGGFAWWPMAGIAALTIWTFVRPTPAARTASAPPDATTPSARERRVTSDPAVALEPGRGRQAEAPTDIPVKGWKDIAFRLYDDINSHRVLAVSAGVTFYVLLAIFPAIAAFVSLYGLFADPATVAKQLDLLATVMPGGAVDIIGEQVRRIAEKGSGSLSFGFVTGLLIALWSANAGMKSLFDALNVVYDEEEKRNFFVLNAMAFAFTLGALAILTLALGVLVVLPGVLDMVGLGSKLEMILTIGRWPVLLVFVALGFSLIYRYGPSRERAKWRWLTPGSAFAAVVWLGGSALFSWYAAHFGSYNATYGSLGAAIGFMTWIWLSATIVLLGGEINAEMELQTARDSTTGRPKPMGARGAAVADQLGRASG